MNQFSKLRFLLLSFISLLCLELGAQSFTLSIGNKKLVSASQFEFDILIKCDSSNAVIPLKFFQTGYRLSPSFINGGILSASYVTGTSDLESNFGKNWGFSFNQSSGVLNQSANIGSVCPGAFIGSAFRRIGRFRLMNSVRWGCADDSLEFSLSGSGHLNLALAKYNTTDCSDAGSVVCTKYARIETLHNTPPLRGYLISLPDASSCDSLYSLELKAEGGLPPYSGIGVFACYNGYYQFTISDHRGCETLVDTVLSSRPIESYFTDSSCGRYLLPWGDTVFQSGLYSYRYYTSSGCDSIVHADIHIGKQILNKEVKTVCKEQLPFQWRGLQIQSAGEFQNFGGDHYGCDSIFILKLLVDSIPIITDSIRGLSSGLCLRREVPYDIALSDSALEYLWQVPDGAIILKGQGSNNILVDYFRSRSDGEVCVTLGNHCGSGNIICRPVSLRPLMTPPISGQNTIRKGQKIYYATSVMGATVYQWSVPSGWQLLSGQGSSRIFVRTGPQSGLIRVLPSNSCGMGNSIEMKVNVSVAKLSQSDAFISFITLRTPGGIISLPIREESIIKEIFITDMSGRRIKHYRTTDPADVSAFSAGIYRITIIGKSGAQNYLFRLPGVR
jgi:hypothetical protein